MVLANMAPKQLMALAFESLAQNVDKNGDLMNTPELFGQMLKKARRK